MVYAPWLGPFGWGIFFIGLVGAIIVFAIKRKFAPVMYLVSIATYIFTVGFIIDVLNFAQSGILLTLGFSAVIFILLGLYFSHKFSRKKESFLDRIPSRK